MPTRNVSLTDKLDRFVASRVASGRYENASEVFRTALRMLEHSEREDELKLAVLKKAIADGDASGIARGDAFAKARKRVRQVIESDRH